MGNKVVDGGDPMARRQNSFGSGITAFARTKWQIRKLSVGFVAQLCRGLLQAGCILIMTGTGTIYSGDVSARSGERPVDALAREMLAAHNAIRAKAKLPPLQWSSELAAYSKRWANTLQAKNLSIHNSSSPYGENIFVTGAGATPSIVVGGWASESRNYDYRTNSCSGDCGHYTQIVWRDTRRVGCAVMHNARRSVWVCSYDPPGNYRNIWPY
jgi:pathogenesis-related protein 1